MSSKKYLVYVDYGMYFYNAKLGGYGLSSRKEDADLYSIDEVTKIRSKWVHWNIGFEEVS
jgi:hypothetical protein